MRSFHENDFKVEEYEEFYENHFFQPVADEQSIDSHRLFPRVRWALGIAKEIKPTKVLDLGCLEGYSVLTLAKHVPSVEVGVGVDLSQDGIELAQRRAEKFKLPVEFIQASIEEYMQNTNEKFDLIMAFELMEHVKDPELVLDLVDKVANKNATFLISTPDFESPLFGKDDERNKCHIRLYTTADEDYEATNKYGTLRKATSLSKQLGDKRKIESMEVRSELIHARIRINI